MLYKRKKEADTNWDSGHKHQAWMMNSSYVMITLICSLREGDDNGGRATKIYNKSFCTRLPFVRRVQKSVTIENDAGVESNASSSDIDVAMSLV